MKRPAAALASAFAILAIAAGASFAQDPAGKEAETSNKERGKGGRPRRVVKTDAEWQKLLTREQYLVTRQRATEPAGTGKYAHYHGKGIFACVCCDTELFDARYKFESGTGWPSFDRPIAANRIITANDYTEAEPRIEVMCAVCDAHLGHVFSDGPTSTGLRYCLNSAALKLEKVPAADPKAKGKTKSTVKAKGTSKAGASAKGKPASDVAKKRESEADPA